MPTTKPAEPIASTQMLRRARDRAVESCLKDAARGCDVVRAAKATVSAESMRRGTNGFSAPSSFTAASMFAAGEAAEPGATPTMWGSSSSDVISIAEVLTALVVATRGGPERLLKLESIFKIVCLAMGVPRSRRSTSVMSPTPAPIAMDATTPTPIAQRARAFDHDKAHGDRNRDRDKHGQHSCTR